jgi:hypothetical protein
MKACKFGFSWLKSVIYTSTEMCDFVTNEKEKTHLAIKSSR